MGYLALPGKACRKGNKLKSIQIFGRLARNIPENLHVFGAQSLKKKRVESVQKPTTGTHCTDVGQVAPIAVTKKQ